MAQSEDVDRLFVGACKSRLKRGVVDTDNQVSEAQAECNATLTVGTNAASFATSYPQYGVFDSRPGRGAMIPLHRIQANEKFNEALVGFGLGRITGVSYAYHWTLMWSNHLNAIWLADDDIEVEGNAAAADAGQVGPRGALIPDDSVHGDEILGGDVVYFEIA